MFYCRVTNFTNAYVCHSLVYHQFLCRVIQLKGLLLCFVFLFGPPRLCDSALICQLKEPEICPHWLSFYFLWTIRWFLKIPALKYEEGRRFFMEKADNVLSSAKLNIEAL